MRCRPSWSLSTLGSKHACDKNRRSSVTYASISVFPPHPIPSSRTTKYVVCCCCLHIKSRSDLYSAPSNIRIGPTDANAFRGHRLTTQKEYTYAAYKTRNIFWGKRHNRVHPGHFATQQGTPFYPAGMNAADLSTLVFTLPRRKIAWVHPTKATFFQNCTLILDKYPVVSENETLPPAISPAEITLRSRQRAPKYTSSGAKHTVRNRHQGPASSSSA